MAIMVATPATTRDTFRATLGADKEVIHIASDTQSRKWQLTLNNPADKGLDHDEIKRRLFELRSVEYFCLADEVGLETQTPHTHIYIVSKSPVRFSTIKRRFPDAHIEEARGSSIDNKNYVAKTGKWAADAKADTSVPGTFEEWGELPENEPGQGFRSDITQLYAMIYDGKSNAEIMATNPALAVHISRMDKIRQDILEARYRDEWRDLDITYIFGPTATGKTRGVMEKHGYSSVYRVTDYVHPFDRYAAETTLLFDEFRSSLLVGDMLDYLDGYPLNLPARYAPRVACYTSVFIISNIDLREQYPNVQRSEPATWKAFLRRINRVVEYRKNGPPIDHGNAMDYIFPPSKPVPDWVKEAEAADDYDQLPL